MKILQLDFDDLKNPNGGGQARVTFEVNRRLAKNHQVTVVTSKFPGSKDEVIEGIKYIRVGLENFPWDFGAFFLLAPKILKTYDYDVLIESFTAPSGTTFAPLFTKKPIIAMVHWLFANEMSKKYKIPFFALENLGLRLYKNFVVYNEDWACEILRRRPNANIKTIHFANKSSWELQFFEEDFILFLGRLDIHHKGIDLLIKAFEKLPKNTKTILKIAGAGRDEKRLRRLVNNSSAKNKIEFLGKLDEKSKNYFLERCKFLAISSRYDTGPLVATEAMDFGKPVITFDILGIHSILSPECGIKVKPFDVVAYSKAMFDLIQNRKKRIEMGKAARKYVSEKFLTWDQSAASVENFINEICSKSKK